MTGTKVLLAHRDTAFAADTKIVLSHRQISASVATSGEQALTLLEVTPDFDVVLYDADLLDSEGLSLLRQILTLFPTMNVILLASPDTLESAIKAMEAGAFDYLLRPYDPEELFAKIEEAKTGRHKQRNRILDAGARALKWKWGERGDHKKQTPSPTDT